jgi:hypothetical protein
MSQLLKIKVETKTVTQVNRTVEYKLTDVLILDLLRGAGVTFPAGCEADVFVMCPGGGDWSGGHIYISKETPLVVRVETTERKEE